MGGDGDGPKRRRSKRAKVEKGGKAARGGRRAKGKGKDKGDGKKEEEKKEEKGETEHKEDKMEMEEEEEEGDNKRAETDSNPPSSFSSAYAKAVSAAHAADAAWAAGGKRGTRPSLTPTFSVPRVGGRRVNTPLDDPHYLTRMTDGRVAPVTPWLLPDALPHDLR